MQSPSNPTNYGEKIYEGKAKILYRAPDGSLFHYFKDSATAFNAQKKAEFEGKGRANLRISSLLFTYLKSKAIPTHFLKVVDERTFQTLSLKMLPVEVVVRNRLAGSLAKRLGEKEGAVLNPPVVEFYLKDDAKGDPLVSEDVLVSLYAQKLDELSRLKALSLQVNTCLSEVFRKAEFTLADFKLEFGKTEKGEIVLADEISPDTCRLWDVTTGEKFDKDRFRFDLGDLMEGYRKVVERLQGVLS
jgi:phosphoribosylaminoimidazole-succinocarboxamide synthase